MKNILLNSALFAIGLLVFVVSCKKDETSKPTDLVAPEVTIVSPPPAHDTIINGQVYQIYSSFQAGTTIPINVTVSDNEGLDSIYVEVIDSTSLSKIFSASWLSTNKNLVIDTNVIAPSLNSICSIKVEAYDQSGNVLGRVRAFGINP